MRDTFALLGDTAYRLRAVATLLDVSENTLRSYLKESKLEIRRQSDDKPGSPPIRLFSIQNVFDLAAWRREKGYVKPLSPSPIVISVDIIKGGTGKSTTTAELGVLLSLAGYRVLMIDLDSQSNLTQILGYESDLDDDDREDNDLSDAAIIKGTFKNVCEDFLKHRKSGMESAGVDPHIKRPYGANGPALIASDLFFGDLDQELHMVRGHRERVFRDLFAESSRGAIPSFDISQFDFVLFDCPPANNMVSTNALAAADYVVAPVKMDSFAVKGVSRLVGEIKFVDQQTQHRPKLVILPTQHSPNLSRVHRMWHRMQAYRSSILDDSIFISTSEMFPKSLELYMPLTLQNPTSAPVKEYRNFMNRLLAKISEDVASKTAAMETAA